MIQLDTSATKPADLRGPLFVRTGKIVYKQLVWNLTEMLNIKIAYLHVHDLVGSQNEWL